MAAGDEPTSLFDFQRRIELKEWSMVVIRDSHPNGDLSIFPPSNHENLQPPSTQQHQPPTPDSSQSNSPPSSFRSSQSSSSFSSLSFSDDEASHPQSSEPPDCRLRQPVAGSRWMVVGVRILRSRIASMASSVWSNAGRRTAVWLLVALWWLYKRARQRRLRRSTERLKMMIRDKDEKINQLLKQVAQLNRSLLAQQKVLPSN